MVDLQKHGLKCPKSSSRPCISSVESIYHNVTPVKQLMRGKGFLKGSYFYGNHNLFVSSGTVEHSVLLI